MVPSYFATVKICAATLRSALSAGVLAPASPQDNWPLAISSQSEGLL
jgi:hypothetical protein